MTARSRLPGTVNLWIIALAESAQEKFINTMGEVKIYEVYEAGKADRSGYIRAQEELTLGMGQSVEKVKLAEFFPFSVERDGLILHKCSHRHRGPIHNSHNTTAHLLAADIPQLKKSEIIELFGGKKQAVIKSIDQISG